jgi:hypothetical protein
MPTFLATSRMSPEFRRRLAASVRGKSVAPGTRLAPRSRSWLRLGAISVTVAAIVTLAVAVRRDRAALEATRNDLAERARREAATLTSEEQRTPELAKAWLERQAGPYAGDTITKELRGHGAFASTLSRPMIYVRGPLGSFRSAAGIAESAGTSLKDPLVWCLMDPPAARQETTLLGRVRRSFARRGAAPDPTEHVVRLRDALAGIPLLAPDWQRRVRAAENARELQRLERDFERAPLVEAKRAAKAELLLFAMDEPPTRPGPVELDGERAHDVRVGLVDLRAQTLLLLLRLPVDPGFISPNVRAEYAGAIDSCALALDIHTLVAGHLERAAAKEVGLTPP